MPKDHGIHGKRHTPGHIVAKCGQRQTHEILCQHLTVNKQVLRMQFYIFAQGRYNDACHQFHQSGQGCGNGNTGSSQLRHAEQSEDKCGIQNDIQYESQHIQRHTDRHTAYASQDGKIHFRDAPAQVCDAHDPQIRGTDGDQLLIRCKEKHHLLREEKCNQRNNT